MNVEVNRPEAAKYGLTIADVQQAVVSGIGGMNVAENVEGRERYPINVRYERDFRDNVDELRRVLIATPSGAQIPINQVANLSFSRGPAMIRDEDGQLTGYVYVDLEHERLWRIRTTSFELAATETATASGIHIPMVRRIRI